jgi:hypothetical protein
MARLWLRELRSEVSRPLDGTENPRSPFWSPESDEIGFFSGGAMMRVAVTGGRPTTITRLPPGSRTTPTATWGADGTIVFQFSTGQGLSQVSIQTGGVRPATTFSPEDQTHFSPHFLGDGRRFIYHTVWGHRIGSVDGAEPRVFDFADGLGQGDATVGYVRGYLVSRRSGALVATPIDGRTLEASGASFRILDEIPASGRGDVPFSVSTNGVLAYWTRGIREPTVFRWIDRDGSISEPLTVPESHSGSDLASGDDRIVFSRFDTEDNLDVWIRDLNRGGEERITLDGNSAFPVWSPDGESIAYQSARAGPPDLFRYRLDGSGEERLTDDTAFQMMESWAPSGEALVFGQFNASSSADLWRLRLGDPGGPESEPLSAVNTEPGNEIKGQVSPDGRFIAYQSDASGRPEILVAGFPSGQPRRTVSVGGGRWPKWRADGQELFYASIERELMSVRIRATNASGFDVDPPERLFPFPAGVVSATGAVDDDRPFVPASDGERFLLLFRSDDPHADPIHIIVNWPALIEE